MGTIMAGLLTSHDIKEFLDLKGIKCSDSWTFLKNVYVLSYNCVLRLYNESRNEDCEEPYDWAIRISDGHRVTFIDNNEFFQLPMKKEELFDIIETEWLKGKLEML